MADRTPSGITVKRIRPTAECKAEIIRLLNENGIACDFVFDYVTGIVETLKGEFLITDEGTGSINPITDKKYPWAVFPQTVNSMSIMSYTFILESEDVEEYEQLPLEKHIRTFGSRLESNYHKWVNALR